MHFVKIIKKYRKIQRSIDTQTRHRSGVHDPRFCLFKVCHPGLHHKQGSAFSETQKQKTLKNR